ncbi:MULTISPECIES: DUF202 domain-containing protein [unclassified Haladaptatus]|uniref:DUF202 domain-containing protein n=1 Tax=unclassified Haladaptatus TaxID=2622732 RepID=UPI00209C2C34|nr:MULTISPECIES: DUF202 domain-containing protein [unclassified Haladaptatus]MCO8244324.1 DUF202 domain-containing protein [Haladaptatus sp. AB643]MCO8254052.1 DUF202 domain-containing protein [Haladaptatus sp. AB618]
MPTDATDATDSIDSTDEGPKSGVADERTRLAWTRTILSYVRTGFASFIFGIALIRLFAGRLIDYVGITFLVVGVLFVLGGLYLFVTSR